MANLRCRSEGYVSRGWVGLPPDFHWAKNSEEPQNSEILSAKASRFLDNRMFAKRAFYCRLESPLRSPEEIFRKPHPIPACVTLCTAAWIVADSAYMKPAAIHILSGEQIRLQFYRHQMYMEHILKPNIIYNERNVLLGRSYIM